MPHPPRRKATPKDSISEPVTDEAKLPRAVALIRGKIVKACEKGDIEALRIPIDWNEVRPLFERGAKRPPGLDPIEHLKMLSFDGTGRELIGILANVLHQPFVVQTTGQTRMYIWPAFALKPPADPTPDQRQAMLSCVRFADLGRSDAAGRPPPMRVGIASDGVWHYFWSADPAT